MSPRRAVTGIITATVFATAFMAPSAWSMPIQAGWERTVHSGDLRRVSDFDEECWWWGVRWQFGWRGYGWYSCWDTAKPVAPQLVAPEAVPPDAVAADACWRRWQDNKGNWHKRRVC